MQQLFRLRHVLSLVTLVGVGLVPLYASHRLGSGEATFGALAPTIEIQQGSLTVNDGGAGAGPGNVGALTYTPDATNITAAGGGSVLPAGDPATVSALASLAATDAALITEGTNDGTDLSENDGSTNLSGNRAPGVYFVNENATIDTTLTLNGAGDYLFVINGTLSMPSGSSVVLTGPGGINVANAANVYFSVAGASFDDADFAGILVSSGDVNVGQMVTVDGKVLVYGAGSALIVNADTNPPAITDAGQAPHINVTGAALNSAPALTGDGSQANPYVVTEGQTLSYTVTGFDPDNDGSSVNLISDDDDGDIYDADTIVNDIDNFTETPELPESAANSVSTNVTFAPPVGGLQTGDTFPAVYIVEDASGATSVEEVWIYVNALPNTGGPAGVTGQAPLATGTGTAGDPFIACVGDTLSFDVTGSDPAADGGPTTLDVTGANGSFTFTPGLPLTENDDSVTTSVDFTPTVADGGSTFTLTFTTTDEVGATTSSDVVIFASSLPAFGAPFTAPQIVTACVGETLQYDVVASDPDPGASLFLYVDGTPVGAEHNRRRQRRQRRGGQHPLRVDPARRR
ncbi:MAG: Ice-binding-like [Armatimonadetes bacterium]|nr:Ice-binding-like [Armatimonadota bacterium]